MNLFWWILLMAVLMPGVTVYVLEKAGRRPKVVSKAILKAYVLLSSNPATAGLSITSRFKELVELDPHFGSAQS